jgi:hypothetical protein
MVLDTLNIVGRGYGMELAPEENCWGINNIIFERSVDIHFDMHHEGRMKPHQIERREKVIRRAKELDIPVYACDSIPDTTYIRYPIESVIREFRTGYFSNGICYMIALAVMNGVKELNFYGVNHTRLKMLDEYTLQKPGVDYWLGVALGRGVKLNIHGAHSEIGKTFDNRAYGYFLSQEAMIKKYGQKK